MSSRLVTGLLLGVLVAQGAHAQTRAERPWTVRAGIGQYTDSAVRDSTDKAPWILGIGYDVVKGKASKFGDTGSVELDGAFSRGNGNRVDVATLGYTHRWNLAEPSVDGSVVYGGLGVGVSRTSARLTAFVEGLGSVTATRNENRVGGQVVIGYRVGKKGLVEAGYRLAGKVDDGRLDQAYVVVGAKF